MKLLLVKDRASYLEALHDYFDAKPMVFLVLLSKVKCTQRVELLEKAKLEVDGNFEINHRKF